MEWIILYLFFGRSKQEKKINPADKKSAHAVRNNLTWCAMSIFRFIGISINVRDGKADLGDCTVMKAERERGKVVKAYWGDYRCSDREVKTTCFVSCLV